MSKSHILAYNTLKNCKNWWKKTEDTPARQGEISHHLASLGKYNSIVGIDQGGPETKISQLYQIWKFRLMPIFGHAHIWPIWAQPHTTRKLKLFKYGQMIYQSKANLTLIKNRNRTWGRKSTWVEILPILGHALIRPTPICTGNWTFLKMVISYINR